MTCPIHDKRLEDTFMYYLRKMDLPWSINLLHILPRTFSSALSLFIGLGTAGGESITFPVNEFSRS